MSKMWVSLVDKTTYSNGEQIANRKNGFGTLALIPVTILEDQIEQQHQCQCHGVGYTLGRRRSAGAFVAWQVPHYFLCCYIFTVEYSILQNHTDTILHHKPDWILCISPPTIGTPSHGLLCWRVKTSYIHMCYSLTVLVMCTNGSG